MADEMRQDSPESRDSKRKATDKQRTAGINNLKRFNASRNNKPNMKHGIKSFIATGAAPTAIEKRLDAVEHGLIQDLGGKPTTAQICLIQALRTCLGIVWMTHDYIQKGGLGNFRNSRWIMEICAAYSNSIRLHLQALDVSWSGKDANNLADDLATRRKKGSLAAAIAATPDPTNLPTWHAKTADCEDVG
jgi:hypothetical protein